MSESNEHSSTYTAAPATPGQRSLAGQVALVTGASSGIGAAVAKALSAQGAHVVVAARREDRLIALSRELVAPSLAVVTDVKNEADCRATVDRVVDHFGKIDMLINNAGVMLLGPIEGADTRDWQRMVDTNVLGSMFMTHAALPHLLDSEGSIVFMSSVDGRVAGPLTGGYNASKWALNGFAESLRQEVTHRGVRVVVVEPGATETELASHITHADTSKAVATFAASLRLLTADDVARVVTFAVAQPPHVAINEILLRPTDQQR